MMQDEIHKGRRRGHLTRSKMLEVAIDAFSRMGYEGVSTRELAKSAGLNLGAIRYHFGGKEGLYQASIQRVADGLRERMSPFVQEISSRTEKVGLQRGELIDSLCELIGMFASQLLSSGVSDSWARLLIREQINPTDGFPILYEVMRLVIEGAASIIAKILKAPPDSEDVRIRTMTLLGQALVFRSHRASAMRFIGWKSFGSREMSALESVLSDQCRAIMTDASSV